MPRRTREGGAAGRPALLARKFSRAGSSEFYSWSTPASRGQQPPRVSTLAMPNSTEPTAVLSHLHRADGSASFSQNGYTVIGSVNGPIEVQRRDELPEEAAVDVIVRPAAGVGGMFL
jgi:hypothetical protein